MTQRQALGRMARCRLCWLAVSVGLAGAGTAAVQAQTTPPADIAGGTWAVPIVLIAAIQSVVMIAGAAVWIYSQYRALKRKEQIEDDAVNQKGLRGQLTLATEEIEQLKNRVESLNARIDEIRGDYERRLEEKHKHIAWLSATNDALRDQQSKADRHLSDMAHQLAEMAEMMALVTQGQAENKQTIEQQAKATRRKVGRTSREIVEAIAPKPENGGETP